MSKTHFPAYCSKCKQVYLKKTDKTYLENDLCMSCRKQSNQRKNER